MNDDENQNEIQINSKIEVMDYDSETTTTNNDDLCLQEESSN